MAYDWFETVYAQARAREDALAVPWEDGQPHPSFTEWVVKNEFQAEGPQKALVVACGLGHDAEALVDLGFQVTAFDVSPTAIAWCRQHFPETRVDYRVADLFDPPSAWTQAFDFVLEVYTIQALPPALHEETVAAISRFVTPGGRLLACCLGRDADVVPSGPPWPLARAELAAFEQCGLQEVRFEDYLDGAGARRFRAEYKNQ